MAEQIIVDAPARLRLIAGVLRLNSFDLAEDAPQYPEKMRAEFEKLGVDYREDGAFLDNLATVLEQTSLLEPIVKELVEVLEGTKRILHEATSIEYPTGVMSRYGIEGYLARFEKVIGKARGAT